VIKAEFIVITPIFSIILHKSLLIWGWWSQTFIIYYYHYYELCCLKLSWKPWFFFSRSCFKIKSFVT